MFKNIWLILIILTVSCGLSKNREQNIPIEDTVYNVNIDPIFKYDTSKMSYNERLDKLIAISCLKKFDQSRNEFIESTSDGTYNISRIVKKGDNYSYEVTSDVYQIGMKYNCIPKKGEYTMDVIGDESLVDMYYDKIKLITKWDECNKVDGNESCNALKKIEPYPIKTYFKFDYMKLKNGLIHLSYFRKQIPESIN